METNCSAALSQLEAMYDVLNLKLFENTLQRPIITIQSTPKYFGHITTWEAWKAENDLRKEINLGAEWLTRPIVEVAATLVHEMTHQENMINDIQDISRGGYYHNKRFKETAEAHGIIIDYDKRIGWSLTTPGPALIAVVKNAGWPDLPIARGARPKNTKKPSSTRKYQCPQCKQSVRATKTVRIRCDICDCEMVEDV